MIHYADLTMLTKGGKEARKKRLPCVERQEKKAVNQAIQIRRWNETMAEESYAVAEKVGKKRNKGKRKQVAVGNWKSSGLLRKMRQSPLVVRDMGVNRVDHSGPCLKESGSGEGAKMV